MDLREDAANNVDEDPYAFVSGFFGQGAVFAWYLLMLSIAIIWYFIPERRFRLSADFLAAIAYPIIAAGYLLNKTSAFPVADGGGDYLVAEIDRLHFAGERIAAIFSQDIAEAPLNGGHGMSPLLPYVLALDPAFCIVELFQLICLVTILVAVVNSTHHHRFAAIRLVYAGLLWSWIAILVLCIKTYSYGGFLVVFICFQDSYYSLLLPIFVSNAVVFTSVLREEIDDDRMQIGALFDGQIHLGEIAWIIYKWLLSIGTILGLGFGAYALTPLKTVIPSFGVPISELDQAAALAVGAIALGYNAWNIARGSLSRRWKIWSSWRGRDQYGQIALDVELGRP